jgi:hypothetical protein
VSLLGSLEPAEGTSSPCGKTALQIVHTTATCGSSHTLETDKARMRRSLTTNRARKPDVLGLDGPRRYQHRMARRSSSKEWPPSSGLSLWRSLRRTLSSRRSLRRTLSSRRSLRRTLSSRLSKGRRTPSPGCYSGSSWCPDRPRRISVWSRRGERNDIRLFCRCCWCRWR